MNHQHWINTAAIGKKRLARIYRITKANFFPVGFGYFASCSTIESKSYANGNTTAMPDKNISAIAYNFLNLSKQISQNANVSNYYYRADGVKVKKMFTLTNAAGTKIINTEYLDGFQSDGILS